MRVPRRVLCRADAALGAKDAALTRLAKVLAADPAHGEANLNYGVILEESGQLDAGLAHINRALRIDPRNPDFLFVRGTLPRQWLPSLCRAVCSRTFSVGVLAHKHGELLKAAYFYRKCLGIDAENVNALTNLGLVCQVPQLNPP